jgi:hypothetical protein
MAIPINVDTIGLTIENETKEVSYFPFIFFIQNSIVPDDQRNCIYGFYEEVSRATFVGFNDLLVKPINFPKYSLYRVLKLKLAIDFQFSLRKMRKSF